LPEGEEEELEAGGEGDVYVKEIYNWNWDGGSATSIEGDHHYKVSYAEPGEYTIQVTCNVEVRRVGTDELLASAGPSSASVTIYVVDITSDLSVSGATLGSDGNYYCPKADTGNVTITATLSSYSGSLPSDFMQWKKNGINDFSNQLSYNLPKSTAGTFTITCRAGNGGTQKSVTIGIGEISSDSACGDIWYFNETYPTGYATQMTLTLGGVGTVTSVWTVTAGGDYVCFENDLDTITHHNNQCLVISEDASRDPNDVTITVTVAGATVATYTFTVMAPQHVVLTPTVRDSQGVWHQQNPYDESIGGGYATWYGIQVLDMFGTAVPNVPVNEWFGTYYLDADPCNWGPPTPVSGSLDAQGRFRDKYASPTAPGRVPSPVNPGAANWNVTPVCHIPQHYYVGTSSVGGGRIVSSHTVQYYIGCGRHQE